MIEDSLLKTNFIGKDGFNWWIGQVAPIEAQEEQVNGEGWGNRFRVRILGYHPVSKSQLPDTDLPWAIAMLSNSDGTGGAGKGRTVRLSPSDVVIGFFIDGDNAQVPIIIGALGRTSDVAIGAAGEGFEPFSAYTNRVPEADGVTAYKIEDNENNKKSGKTGYVRRKLDGTGEKINGEEEEVILAKSFSDNLTDDIANTCDDGFLNGVNTTINTLFGGLSSGLDLFSEVASATKKLENLSTGVVNNSMNKLYKNMLPKLSTGLDAKYNEAYNVVLAATRSSSAADLAGIAAQKAFVSPIKNLQSDLDCLPGKIQAGLGKTIRGLLEKTISEVATIGPCISEQITGGLLNTINDQIASNLSGALGGVSALLPGAFKVEDFLTSTASAFTSIGGFFDCNQDKSKCTSKVNLYNFGTGASPSPDLLQTYNKAIQAVNEISGGADALQNPQCGVPDFCSGPKVTFFGGDGFGAFGTAILGEFVQNTDGLSEVTADVSRTASIIGIEITDPGDGYFNSPPLISIQDSCGRGYGAVARANIDYDPNSPTYGKVQNVDVISIGENYPVGQEIDSETDVVGVVDAVVVTGGSGYEDAQVVDSNGIEYNVTIGNGQIISAQPINNIAITNLPTIKITSSTGVGAFIKPIIRKLDLDPQGEIIQIIDCVGPETNLIVGYVNGKPYSGPFHIHKGVKMVGAVHTKTPHDIIYDTPAQSLTSQTIAGLTTTTTTQNMNVTQPIVTPTTDMSPPSTPPSTPPSAPPSTPSDGGGYGGY